MEVIHGKFGEKAKEEEVGKIVESIQLFMAMHLDENSTGKFLVLLDVDGKDLEDEEVLLGSNYNGPELNYVLDVLKLNLLLGG